MYLCNTVTNYLLMIITSHITYLLNRYGQFKYPNHCIITIIFILS